MMEKGEGCWKKVSRLGHQGTVTPRQLNQQTQQQSGGGYNTLQTSTYIVLKTICIHGLVLWQVTTNLIASNQVYCNSVGWNSPRISLAQIKLSSRWHSSPYTPRAFNTIPLSVSMIIHSVWKVVPSFISKATHYKGVPRCPSPCGPHRGEFSVLKTCTILSSFLRKPRIFFPFQEP